MNYTFHPHALERMAQRNLSHQDIGYVIQYGRKIHNAGALNYFLGFRDIPLADRADQRVAQLVGTLVLVDVKQGEILTVYRNNDGGKGQRKKAKYRRRRETS
ncbi:MAG TPA: DUF4258 domain-containing protein [Aggregatilineales bacterium]|nr:DUF4258 domain-containing protein [Aggregatilineales bacterium]